MLGIVVIVSVVRRTATSATVFSVDCVIYSFMQGQWCIASFVNFARKYCQISHSYGLTYTVPVNENLFYFKFFTKKIIRSHNFVMFFVTKLFVLNLCFVVLLFFIVQVCDNNSSFQKTEGLHLVDKPLLKTISFDSMNSVKKLGMKHGDTTVLSLYSSVV